MERYLIFATALVGFGLSQPAYADSITLKAGAIVNLRTNAELSSRSSVKGDTVPLELTDDLVIDAILIAPKGAPAVGIIEASRVKGGMGQNGKLSIQPLYMRIGNQTIRLSGAANAKGKISGGQVIGLAVVSGAFSGRSAVIPIGTAIAATIMRDTIFTLPPK